MPLIPAFEIGVWNAWILMLYYPLNPIVMILIDKLVGKGEILQKMEDPPYKKNEKLAFSVAYIMIILLFLYSIFLPLKLDSLWIYIGIVIYLLGLIMFEIANINIATTAHGEPFVKGLYRYSRHPMTFFSFCTFIGIGIATASWIFLLLSITVFVSFRIYVIAEERGCIEEYGDAYREYMNRTPRWIGIPKS